MDDTPNAELTETEREALHCLQLGIEYIYRGYGSLLEFHHSIGHGMDYFDEATTKLRDTGHDDLADALRDEHLAAGVFEDAWTYEVVEAFQQEMLADITDFESEARAELADGRKHITERRQQDAWCGRAADETEDGE